MYTFKELSKDNKLEVQVELDEDEKFVKAIKTIEENAINKFDVTFEQINETIVEEPKEFFAKDSVAVTEDDIKEFYEKGLAWWKSNINKGAYQF